MTIKKLEKLFAAALLCLCAGLLVQLYSVTREQENGAVVYRQRLVTEEKAVLPEKYDLREQKKAPTVKNQGDFGTCWAMASSSALESVLLPEEKEQFSADHMSLLNSFSRSQNDGGDYTMVMAYLAGWQGPVLEKDDPYGDGVSDESLAAVKHVQEMQVLQDVEHTLIDGWQALGAPLSAGMNIAMTQLMIEIAHADLDEIAHVALRIRGQERVQRAVIVPRGVQKMRNLERIPVHEIGPTADEAARLLRLFQFIDRAAVRVQIARTQIVDDRHHVNVALLRRLAAHIAPLQAHIDQPLAIRLAQKRRKTRQIALNIEHSASLPRIVAPRNAFPLKAVPLIIALRRDVRKRRVRIKTPDPAPEQIALQRGHAP